MSETAPKVFIVDDDPSARKGLLLLLRSAGFEGEAFPSAREFLDQPPFSGVGCVILDVRMPGMTGLELRDRMAEKDISLPIVFLTGHGDLPMGVEAMKKGAVDFLQKPVDDEALLEAVRRALALHAAARAQRREQERNEARLERLTTREREVMEYVIGGWLNKQIAAELGISEITVKAHRGSVMRKMGAGSVAELIRQCEAAGVPPRLPALPGRSG